MSIVYLSVLILTRTILMNVGHLDLIVNRLNENFQKSVEGEQSEWILFHSKKSEFWR